MTPPVAPLTRPDITPVCEDLITSPYKADFPLLVRYPQLAFLDSAATAQRPATVLEAQRDFYERLNSNPLRGLYKLSVEATEAIDKEDGQGGGVEEGPVEDKRLFGPPFLRGLLLEEVPLPLLKALEHPVEGIESHHGSSPSFSDIPQCQEGQEDEGGQSGQPDHLRGFHGSGEGGQGVPSSLPSLHNREEGGLYEQGEPQQEGDHEKCEKALPFHGARFVHFEKKCSSQEKRKRKRIEARARKEPKGSS